MQKMILMFICSICVLFSCEKKIENKFQDKIVSTGTQVEKNKTSSANNLTIEEIEKFIIGKKIKRFAHGPDDTASFEIIIQKAGKIEGNTSNTMSWATGVLYFKSGKWQIKGNNLELLIDYEGLVSEPTNDGYRRIKKIQTQTFSVLLEELLKSKGDFFELI